MQAPAPTCPRPSVSRGAEPSILPDGDLRFGCKTGQRVRDGTAKRFLGRVRRLPDDDSRRLAPIIPDQAILADESGRLDAVKRLSQRVLELRSHHDQPRLRVHKPVRKLHVPRRASAFSKTKHTRLTLRRAERPDRPFPRLGYLPLTAIRFTFDCACGAFGMVTVKTPFLNAADTLSSSTSSTGILRSNRP